MWYCICDIVYVILYFSNTHSPQNTAMYSHAARQRFFSKTHNTSTTPPCSRTPQRCQHPRSKPHAALRQDGCMGNRDEAWKQTQHSDSSSLHLQRPAAAPANIIFHNCTLWMLAARERRWLHPLCWPPWWPLSAVVPGVLGAMAKPNKTHSNSTGKETRKFPAWAPEGFHFAFVSFDFPFRTNQSFPTQPRRDQAAQRSKGCFWAVDERTSTTNWTCHCRSWCRWQ